MYEASPEKLLASHAGSAPRFDPAFKLFGRTIPFLPVSHRKRKWEEENSTDASVVVSADESYNCSTLQDVGDESPESENQSHGDSVADEHGSSSGSNDGCDEVKPDKEMGKSSATPASEVSRVSVADLPIKGRDGDALKTELDDEGAEIQDMTPKKPEKPVPCPRCDSRDTKFCYFNNYNVNQPRHFCKSCQRYWTAGGTLRNVPVGAGRRKSKHTASQHRSLPPDALVVRRDSPDSAQQLLSCPGSSPVGLNRRLKMGPSPSRLHLQPLDVCSLTTLDSPSSSTILNFGQESPLCDSVSAASYSPPAAEILKGYRSEVSQLRLNKLNYAPSEADVISSRPMQENSKSPNESQNQGQSCRFSSARDVNHETNASTRHVSRPVASVQTQVMPLVDSKRDPSTKTDDSAITVDSSVGWGAGGPLAFVGDSCQYCSNIGWCNTPLSTPAATASGPNSNTTDVTAQAAVSASHPSWGGAFGSLWGGIPWPYVQSPMWGPPFWGGAWTVPWAAAAAAIGAAATAVKPTLESPTPARHDAEERESNRSGNGGSLWVPKTLRIDDPGEAAQSSIWMALGLEDRFDSKTPGGMFSSLQKKADSKEADDSPIHARHSNPAAMTRSIAFQESNLVLTQKIDVQGT